MDAADSLVKKINYNLELQKKCADKLDEQANELEGTKKTTNVTKVVGSSVSVAGSAVMTLAGVATIFTGGAALPVIALAGGAASWLGLATNATSDVAGAIVSGTTLNEAQQVAEKIETVNKEIEELVESLKEEVQKKGEQDSSCSDDHVTEHILRVMAKSNGLILDDSVSLKKNLEEHFGQSVKTAIWSFISNAIKITAILIAESVGAKLAAKLGATLAREAARSAGGRTAAKAAGRMAGGALGLAISIPELIGNCKNLNNSETEASKSLRESAKSIRKESEEMEEELKKLNNLFQGLAKVKRCIEDTERSGFDRKTSVESAMKQCNDEHVRKWLKENSESDNIFKLMNMFQFM